MKLVIDKARLYLNDVLWGERLRSRAVTLRRKHQREAGGQQRGAPCAAAAIEISANKCGQRVIKASRPGSVH